MAPKLEKLPIPELKLGEGPHWDIASQSLYLVDIGESKLVRYDTRTNNSYIAKLEIPDASFIIPVYGSKGKFIVGSGINLYLIKWDGVSEKVDSISHLHRLSNDHDGNRINDGKCDSNGRLWFGTMNKENCMSNRTGKFYSFTKEEGCLEHSSNIGLSNGLSWYGNTMYYIDSLAFSVDAFDYNSNGSLKNRRIIFDFKKHNFSFIPDGMTIDKDGQLWVACFDGSRVLHLKPETGQLLDEITIPTSQVTSVAYGGPNLEDLFVTTANLHKDEAEHPGAGSTYRITGLDTKGLPMNEFKL